MQMVMNSSALGFNSFLYKLNNVFDLLFDILAVFLSKKSETFVFTKFLLDPVPHLNSFKLLLTAELVNRPKMLTTIKLDDQIVFT